MTTARRKRRQNMGSVYGRRGHYETRWYDLDGRRIYGPRFLSRLEAQQFLAAKRAELDTEWLNQYAGGDDDE